MNKLIKIDNKWYNLLYLQGGYFYVGEIFDINNNVIKQGVIWEQKRFFEQHEFWYGYIFNKTVRLIRFIKQLIFGDAFGKRILK
jgi:hypothetical protein